MSSFARAAAASIIRRHCFRGGFSSRSSCSLLWRRNTSSNSIVSGENPNPNPNPNHQQCPDPNNPNNPNNPSLTNQEAPWLLLSSRINHESRYLYDLTIGINDDDQGREYFDKKLNRELRLPDIAECIFIGSSEGFLIAIDESPDTIVHAFNPLTGSHLPPIPRFPPSLTRNDHSNYNNDECLRLYPTKAILSPSLDTIVILPGPGSCHSVVFAPLPSSSSSSLMWKTIPEQPYCYEGIFHKGILHVTNHKGELHIFDRKCNKLVAAIRLSWEPYCLRSSLVESPDGDDLFLVYRSIDDVTWGDPYPRHFISVYKLRFNQKKRQYEWDQVKSIGGLAFFVGTKSASLSLDVSDRHLFPTLKPNSVYFSDTWSVEDDGEDPEVMCQAGVCTLEDERFHYIKLNDGAQLQLHWPPPVWYMPSTSAMQD